MNLTEYVKLRHELFNSIAETFGEIDFRKRLSQFGMWDIYHIDRKLGFISVSLDTGEISFTVPNAKEITLSELKEIVKFMKQF